MRPIDQTASTAVSDYLQDCIAGNASVPEVPEAFAQLFLDYFLKEAAEAKAKEQQQQ